MPDLHPTYGTLCKIFTCLLPITSSAHLLTKEKDTMPSVSDSSSVGVHEAAASESDSSSAQEATAAIRHLCEACNHPPFSSGKALHAHRTMHQTRGDVTLLTGLTAVITRRDEFSDWTCPERDCDYASLHLLRLRAHLRNQRTKRRRQEEANAERAADDADSNVHSSDQVDSSQRNSQSPIPEPSRRVRPRLGVNDTASALRVSLSASPAHVFPRC